MVTEAIEKIQVAVDDRELPSGVMAELEKFGGVAVKIEHLAVGDYCVDGAHRECEQVRITCNARMTPRLLRKYCALDSAGMELLKEAVTNLNLSARAYDRILKVARTIADLAAAPKIQVEHLAEAVQYRALDRCLW